MGNAPSLGGGRFHPDRRLWGMLLGRDESRRAEAAEEVKVQGAERRYARYVLDALSEMQPWHRLTGGSALSLLGDPRFSAPFYLPEMLPVPAGRVIMGSPDYPDEKPMTRIAVRGFSLAQVPVTEAAYFAFVQEANHRRPPHWGRGGPDPAHLNRPVTMVSAADAEAYCLWLSEKTGYRYRLPTEAEWELAARGAEQRRAYPWGERWERNRSNVWGSKPLGEACAVGMFPLGRGVYKHDDLSGNVWEWCSSVYWPYPYNPADGREAIHPDERRVLRGGSWRAAPSSARVSARLGEPPGDRFPVAGFRIARDG